MTAPFASANGVWKSFGKGGSRVEALRGATLAIPVAGAVALVGPSGSGKSTLARCMAGLCVPDKGCIEIGGKPLTTPSPVHLVFQHPSLSMNPRFTVARSIAEPLAIARHGTPASRSARTLELMETVELPAHLADALVTELSGGEKARVALARALCALGGKPGLVVLDETLGSLDLPLQRRIVKLLHRIRHRDSVSILLITHDWNLAVSFTGILWVMDHGRAQEPDCEAGRALAAAAPAFLPEAAGQ